MSAEMFPERAAPFDVTSDEQYFAAKYVSHHGMEAFRRSRPFYYCKYVVGEEHHDEDDEARRNAFDIGTAFHLKVLQPGLDRVKVAPVNGAIRKDDRETLEAFRKEHPGCMILTAPQGRLVDLMVASVKRNPAVAEILSAEGWDEKPIHWIDSRTGLAMKGRPDRVTTGGLLVDFKTTTNLDTEAFSRSILNYGYHRQLALYVDGVNASMGRNLCNHYAVRIVAVSKLYPYDSVVFSLGHASMELASRENKITLREMANCYKTGNWRSPSDGSVVEIDIPHWAFRNR